MKEVRKNKTWEANHIVILDAYFKLCEEHKRSPTQQEVADECQLSRNTINKHYQSICLDDIMPAARIRASKVIHGLAQKAEEGDASAVKLFFQLVFNWTEKSKTENINYEIDLKKLTDHGLERITRGDDPKLVMLDPNSVKLSDSA